MYYVLIYFIDFGFLTIFFLENAKDRNNKKKRPQNAFISMVKKRLFYVQNA